MQRHIEATRQRESEALQRLEELRQREEEGREILEEARWREEAQVAEIARLKAQNPHILMLAPRPDLDPQKLGRSLHQMMAKYSAAMQVIGMAEEFRSRGVAVNALWPRTWVATAAIEFQKSVVVAWYAALRTWPTSSPSAIL